METNLVTEGFKFMVLGMGTVFTFLIIMIICIHFMSKIIHRFFPESQINVEEQNGKEKKDAKKVVAAITAAIIHHRQAQGL